MISLEGKDQSNATAGINGNPVIALQLHRREGGEHHCVIGDRRQQHWARGADFAPPEAEHAPWMIMSMTRLKNASDDAMRPRSKNPARKDAMMTV